MKEMAHHISGKVLDVGCGKKPYQSLFQVDEYVGMDIDKGEQGNKYKSVDVFYDGKTFPFDTGHFDSVISNEVLEHVFNPDEHLAEIHRVLKPEGKFLLTVPFLWDEHEQPYDYARYSSFGLRHLLERNGFEVVEQRKSVADTRAIFQIINLYLYKKTTWMRKNWYFDLPVTMIFNAPFNLLGEIFGMILPKNPDLYIDNILVVKKKVAYV
jgi:SAM-dependent methyltransferase